MHSGSLSRTGNRPSNAAIPKPQNSSTATIAISTRDPRSSRTPSAMARGAWPAARRPARSPVVARTSVISAATASNPATWITSETTTGSSSASSGPRSPSAISPPLASAPADMATPSTTPDALSPRSIGVCGSAARLASTYHASSGPLSSAR